MFRNTYPGAPQWAATQNEENQYFAGTLKLSSSYWLSRQWTPVVTFVGLSTGDLSLIKVDNIWPNYWWTSWSHVPFSPHIFLPKCRFIGPRGLSLIRMFIENLTHLLSIQGPQEFLFQAIVALLSIRRDSLAKSDVLVFTFIIFSVVKHKTTRLVIIFWTSQPMLHCWYKLSEQKTFLFHLHVFCHWKSIEYMYPIFFVCWKRHVYEYQNKQIMCIFSSQSGLLWRRYH